MPDLTPGAERISLVDRFRAFLNPRSDLPPVTQVNNLPFGPGEPVEPTPITQDAAPRRFPYQPSINTVITPRSEFRSNLQLTPFDQLRQLARRYDVASICIETRLNWLTSVKWSITARDKRRQKELQPLCNQVEKFFRRPDRVTPFPIWLRSIMLDQLEIDALSVYKQRDRAGRLIALEPIDGSTIKPLVDGRGRVVAYQQVLYGYVRSELAQPHADVPPSWPVNGDLAYLPRWVSTDSTYGHSPIETLIIRINTALRKQIRDLTHYTDGNIPPGFMFPDKDFSISPEGYREFEDAFNADLAGVDRALNQIKFVPFQGRYQETKPFTYSPEIDMLMLEITCATLHIPKNELGMTDAVNKASSEAQMDVAFRHAVEPDTQWLKLVLFDPVIADDLGFPELEFNWNFGQADDDALDANVEQADIKLGVISPNESRRRRYPDLDGDAPGAVSASPGSPIPSQPMSKIAKLDPGTSQARSGVCVALLIPGEIAGQIENIISSAGLPAEPAEDLHVTLCYLGKKTDPHLKENFFHLQHTIYRVASRMPAITGKIGGIGRFSAYEDDGTRAIWAVFDSPELSRWRQELVDAIEAQGLEPEWNFGFVPHITLAYISSEARLPDLQLPTSSFTIPQLTLLWGDDRYPFELQDTIQKADVTVSTETGLVNNDLAVKRRRKRGKRRRPVIDVAQLIESENAGAIEWAKKALSDG